MARLPQFLAAPESGGGPLPGHAGAPSTNVVPGLALVGQEETNWCWSAVTQAILRYRRGTARTQEQIATEHAARSGKPYTCAPPERKKAAGRACADVACQATCNDAHILRVVLAEQGCFEATLTSGSAPSFQLIRDEIDARRPVPCRVQWSGAGGGGHFIIVSGWTIGADGVERVHVLDPAANEGGRSIAERIMPWTTFAGAYVQSGVSGKINFSYRVR